MTDGTMDVTGSIRKISRELLELRYDSDDLETKLEGAAWLLQYIADALDVELQLAAERGKQLRDYSTNPEGTRVYKLLELDQ